VKYLPLTAFALGLLASPASAASWLFYCGPVDPKTDVKTCAVFDDNIGLSVVFEKKSASTAAQAICLFEGNFNFGRRGMIRIDDQKAIESDQGGCIDPKEILPQLRTGKRLHTRIYERLDREGSLDGFAAAMDKLIKRAF
jgi:hypothetical protein